MCSFYPDGALHRESETLHFIWVPVSEQNHGTVGGGKTKLSSVWGKETWCTVSDQKSSWPGILTYKEPQVST